MNLLWYQECTFYCAHGKKRKKRCIHSAAGSSKRFKSLSVTVLLQQGHCWIGKKHTMLVIWPSSTLKCIFVFDFNICLSYLFLKFGKFLVLYLGCSCATFNFTTQRTLRHLIPRPMNKNLSTKTTKYILKCWESSVKRKSNLSFIRVIKIHILIEVFYMYLAKIFLKILSWRFLVPRSEHLLVSSAIIV